MRRLRVMTYNIHRGRGVDWKVDLGRTADVIKSFDPDVVALQEVDIGRKRSGRIDQPTELAKRLAMDMVFAPNIEYENGERYGLATLTKLPIRDTRHLRLPIHYRSEPRSSLITVLGCVYATAERSSAADAMFLSMTARACQAIRDLGTLDAAAA